MSMDPRTRLDAFARNWRPGVLISLLAACLFRGPVLAQNTLSGEQAPVLLDNMDNAAPALKLLNAGAGIHVVGQSMEQGRGQGGSGSERVLLAIPAGSSALLGYDLPPARVIEESRLAARISCNRPGAQLAATVVLPRSLDPRTGSARQLLVRSGKIASGGESLVTLEDLLSLLADQARVARANREGDIDERGARISQLVILVPGGPGITELVVDQIAMYGVLAGSSAPADPAGSGATIAQVAAQSPVPANGPLAKRPRVPRIIQWQGEPLEMLQKIGFDAVWMGRLPTQHELAETARLGMFIVCPPPLPEQLEAAGVGAEYAPVLAWDLGPLAAAADVELAHRWAKSIEQRETDPQRPVLLQPFGMAREASRIADVVMLGRAKLGSTLTWPDYAACLSQQGRLARRGTPVWVNVETHCSTRFMAQLAAARGGHGAAIVPASFSELSQATTAAFGVAPRGFCFQSHTSLAGDEVENRLRALALELTNLRLGLADPWLAAGKSATAARSTRTDVTGMVLKVERSHLIIPLHWNDNPRPADGSHSQQPLAFDLPGVPESCDAYLVSISGSQRLQGRRVTGGLRIAIDHLPDDAFVLVTEDGYAFSHVERYLREHAPRAAQVRVELAALRRQQAAQAIAKLPPEAVAATGVREELARVDAQMTAVVETMRRRDYAAAFACAAEAERLLDASLQRVAEVVAPGLPAGASPIPADWATIADIASIEQVIRQDASSHQLVLGGEFENLEELLQSGWQRVEKVPAGVQATVRLSPEAPARGDYCLELDAHTSVDQSAPPLLPTPPLWVTSPPIHVPAGHLVEITGMARVGEALIGSSDPLLIFDSVGGEESAIRVASAPSWAPFRLVRAATGQELRITIALGGVGRAQVDSLAYRFIPMRTDAVAQSPPQNR